MDFLEIEYRKTTRSFNMHSMQFHEYYELHFLLSGKREIFVENKLFAIPPSSLCVIPPFSMHKTEGTAYERINLYVNKNLLSDSENALLEKLSQEVVYILNPSQLFFITTLLKEAHETKLADYTKHRNFLLTTTKNILAYIQLQVLTPINPLSATTSQQIDPVILQIIAFINKEYCQPLTLASLSKTFHLSINTLCKRFQTHMNCSLMQYVTYIRLNKAKFYLANTNKNMSAIAELCGFSSANYFSLIFKKQIGISPINYRKKQ